MLKGVDRLLSPDLLQVLAAMGHGDEIVLADANFPCTSTARHTVWGRVIPVHAPLDDVARAVASLLPIDTFDGPAVQWMQVVGDPDALPDVVAACLPYLVTEGVSAGGIERFAFYERARRAFAIVHTSEGRLYGNLILRKGVIPA